MILIINRYNWIFFFFLRIQVVKYIESIVKFIYYVLYKHTYIHFKLYGYYANYV